MKILNQLAIILGLWAIGEYISSFIETIITIPGSIIGMILLFILFKSNIIKLKDINEVSNFFLENMAIFFIPAGVSLIKSLGLISENLFVLIITIFISTIVVMYITGKLVDIMIKRKSKEN